MTSNRMLCVLIAVTAAVLWFGGIWAMSSEYRIYPVGEVQKKRGTTVLKIHEPFRDALLGLDRFSHVIVFFWFDRNDTPEKRRILQVHPRRDARNPLTGVFATRSPVRPNLIGHSIAKIKSIKDGSIMVDEIDAFDGTPIIDLKPYIPAGDSIPGATVPEWVHE
ncbi:MAG: tRNA (N6-threonylcarbamoyladenosine(37)-N6)-methyltransferase TrmO [Thermodesulfobacteriota bacterium]